MMFCGNCGKEVLNPGMFCEFCGSKLEDDDAGKTVVLNTATYSAGIEQPIKKPPMSAAKKTLLIMALIVAVTAVGAYQVGVSRTKPETIVKEYFSYFTKGQYDQLYPLLSLPKGEFLTKEAFIRYMNERYGSGFRAKTFIVGKQKGELDIANQGPSWDNGLMKAVPVTYIGDDNARSNQMEVKLVKTGDKKYFIFDEWKVVLDNIAVQDEWLISVPEGASLFIDGKAISKNNFQSGESQYIDNRSYEIYIIPRIFPCRYNVKAIMKNGEEIFNRTTETNELRISYPASTAEQQDQVEEKEEEKLVLDNPLKAAAEPVDEENDLLMQAQEEEDDMLTQSQVDGISGRDYILPHSSTTKLRVDELLTLSKGELALARNEIFARHGYIFQKDVYRNYFQSKSWYKPNPSFNDKSLNAIEKYNISLIKQYE